MECSQFLPLRFGNSHFSFHETFYGNICNKGTILHFNLTQKVGGRVVRWSWVTSITGASYNLDDSRARAYCACSRCGWGLFGHFNSALSFLLSSPPLWGTARYRLKYCLKGPLDQKQTNKQTHIKMFA